MTRVLLTGASGFIGHHTLSHILKNTNWEVVCLESFKHKGLSIRLEEALQENESDRHRVTVIRHDLQAPIDHITSKKIGPIDLIINVASESHVDRSIKFPREFVENNVLLILTMLEYARTLPNLKLFIQVSTDEVYGPINGETLHKEYDSMVPSNPYSASKAAQEAIAISYWRTYDVPVVITNTMNNIGERQDPEKFVPKIIKTLLAGDKVQVHASKVGDTWVSGSRSYLHAINHADALLFIANNIDNHLYKKSHGIDKPLRFHIPGNKKVTNEEMVKLVSSIMGLDPDQYEYKNYDEQRPGHDPNYGLDPGILPTWGWIPPISFEEGIKRTVDWTVKNTIWLD